MHIHMKQLVISLFALSLLSFASSDDVMFSDLEIHPKIFQQCNMQGDVMVIELVYDKGRIILQNPVTLQPPFFEKIVGKYGMTSHKAVVKSRENTQRKQGFFSRNLGYMIFSQNNIVLFIHSEGLYNDTLQSQWQNTRGYAALMPHSDIPSWLDGLATDSSMTVKLDKHNALVWDLPFLKEKYLKMEIQWGSEKTRDYAISFFHKMVPRQETDVSWRLHSLFGECHGW